MEVVRCTRLPWTPSHIRSVPGEFTRTVPEHTAVSTGRLITLVEH
jgi:hypothetical protein